MTAQQENPSEILKELAGITGSPEIECDRTVVERIDNRRAQIAHDLGILLALSQRNQNSDKKKIIH